MSVKAVVNPPPKPKDLLSCPTNFTFWITCSGQLREAFLSTWASPKFYKLPTTVTSSHDHPIKFTWLQCVKLLIYCKSIRCFHGNNGYARVNKLIKKVPRQVFLSKSRRWKAPNYRLSCYQWICHRFTYLNIWPENGSLLYVSNESVVYLSIFSCINRVTSSFLYIMPWRSHHGGETSARNKIFEPPLYYMQFEEVTIKVSL